MADISEHRTLEGKLCICAIKDVFSNRIVNYLIDSRMKSSIAVNALNSAVAGCMLHSYRGSQFRSRRHVRVLARNSMVGSMGRVGAACDNAAVESFFSLLQKKVLDRQIWNTLRGPTNRDRDLDRTGLPPPTPASHPRPIDPNRIRIHHDHTSQTPCLTNVSPKRPAD